MTPLVLALGLVFAPPLVESSPAPVEPEDAAAPGSESAETDARPAPQGTIRISARDSFDDRRALVGAVVLLQCECLAADREAETDHQGEASFEGLPAGSYEITLFAGRAKRQKSVELGARHEFAAEFRVDPERPPQTEIVQAPRGPQPQYWGRRQPLGHHTDLRNAGVGLLAAGGALGVGALLAGTLVPCNRDGASRVNCAQDTRIHLAVGFGSAAVAMIASGATMVGVAKRRHRIHVEFNASRRGAELGLRGRF